MGITINQLSPLDILSAGDQLPVWAPNAGDTRRASLTTLVTFLSSAFTSLTASSYVKVSAVAVGSLPSAVTAGAGARAMVTDATSSTFNATATGGGANIVPVFSDGTIWKVG